MADRAFAAEPLITVPGELPPAWVQQLVECTVDEAVNTPATATLVFRDPYHKLLSDNGITLGTAVGVQMITVADGGALPLFSGQITGLEAERDDTGSFTVLHATDAAHPLLRTRRVKAFENLDAAGIVREVAKTAKLPVGTVKAGGGVYDRLSQANVTDWEFLRALAAEHGAWLSIDDRGALSFTEPPSASGAPSPRKKAKDSPLVLQYGANLHSLRAVLSGSEQVRRVTVRGWDVRTKKALHQSVPVGDSTISQPGQAGRDAVKKLRTGELLITDGAYRTQSEVDTAAKAQAASVAAAAGELEAVCTGNPHLRVGTAVALGRVGPAFSGRYTISASSHQLGPRLGYRTTVVVSGGEDRTLAGLAAAAPAGPPRMPGLAIGQVTDVNVSKAKDPDHFGRAEVRLRFPWLDDNYVTGWVRTVQWGGDKGGGVVCPAVGDEVLVGFEQGLLDRPYVLGGLYGHDKPGEHEVPLVDSNIGKVNRLSVANREGDRLDLLDEDNGKRGVSVRTADKKLSVELDRAGTKIVVHSDGSVEITAGKSVSIKGTGVEIDAGTGHLALSGQSVSINGTTGVRISGGTEATVRAGIIRLN